MHNLRIESIKSIVQWIGIFMTGDFKSLVPETILTAVEKAKMFPTGEVRQLNSYENRVYEIILEPTPLSPIQDKSIIAKFYRPHRWSKESIREEHEFIENLAAEGMPAIGAFRLFEGETILEHHGFFTSLFPKFRGRMPQEFLDDDLLQIGRRLALLHNVGAQKVAENRPDFDTEDYGWQSLERITQWIEPSLLHDYKEVAKEILEWVDDGLAEYPYIRIHGDCHRGNLLQLENEFYFIDFDDFCNGPEVQDLWMLVADPNDQREFDLILEGYEELRDFDRSQLDLIPGLRGLRIIMYAGWIAARWHDPFFKQTFPQFTTYNYWADELASLKACVNKLT